MSRIEIKSILPNNIKHFTNTLEYIFKPEKSVHGFFGVTNIFFPYAINREYTLRERRKIVKELDNQIKALREYYRQEEQRLGIHLTIAFSPEELQYLNHKRILQIGYFIAQTEFPECVTVFSVHEDGGLLHLHMLIVPIDIKTGLMYGCNKAGWHGIEIRLNRALECFMPADAITSFQVAFGR